MRALIDTCVIIDFATGRDEELLNQSNTILAHCCLKRFEGFITSNAVSVIYYILHHLSHSSETARAYLGRLLDYVSILDVNDADCTKALDSKVSDYEDALMDECAARNKIDYIVTDNLKDFHQSKISAISGKEFIELLMSDY